MDGKIILRHYFERASQEEEEEEKLKVPDLKDHKKLTEILLTKFPS